MNILYDIAAETSQRYELKKREMPIHTVKRIAESRKRDFAFERALRSAGFAVVCEIKKASPSKGLISPEFPYLEQAFKYRFGGADAISCLTEPRHFLGSDEVFSVIRSAVSVPMLRKDFTIDEYQIYESAALGADCVLLICSLLPYEKLKDFLQITKGLGLSALVECRDEEQIDCALKAGAAIIGVNNRNLEDFSVDKGRAAQLRSLVPRDRLFISESGISAPRQAIEIKNCGADGVLIGEALMRSGDPAGFIGEIKNAQG